jgi:lactoylglutathione lyase
LKEIKTPKRQTGYGSSDWGVTRMAGASLSLLVLKTRQVDQLRWFYSALGIELNEEQHGKGPVHYAGRAGDVVLEVYPLTDNAALADSTIRLGFAVASLSKIMEALQTLGIPVISSPAKSRWGFRAVVRDPVGRAIELIEREANHS